MESEVFVKIINDTLKSFGFRKQGVRRWIRTGNDISLKVYLQKSQYGAFYYLRDYYVLNKMQVHFSNDRECPGDIVYSDEKILNMMCDLENDVPDSVRETSIKALLKEAFENHQYIETEEELKKMILRRLPCVFKAIMDYLGIAPELYDSLWKQRKNTSMMQRLAKVFEFSPTSDHEILNEEKGFCVTYNIDDQEILIQINIFINPYTQNVEEVYQEKLEKLKYFTKIVLYENPIKEVEIIDADKPSKLGFMRVKLTILDHVADTEGIERVKDAIFQIHEEQLPYDSPVWFKAEHDGHACYYEREWWSFKRVVIKGDQGFERYDLSDETKYGQKKCGIVTDIYDQLENDESFELISSAAFQEVWDKAEKSHEQEPWE